MKSKTAGNYVLFVRLSPTTHGHDTFPAWDVKGTGYLCTPKGERFTLKIGGDMPRKFYVNMPDDLVREAEAAKDDAAVTEIGIEWCIQQSKELKAAGLPCLHYYTMGDSNTVRRIVSAVA